MFELRYLIRNGWDGPEQVLQYRTQVEVADYSTEKHIKKMIWSEWQYVPTVDETK
jgi:hypothetical protein